MDSNIKKEERSEKEEKVGRGKGGEVWGKEEKWRKKKEEEEVLVGRGVKTKRIGKESFVKGAPAARKWGNPKLKLCQHMVRVKSLRRGWTFNWEGTRDGQIFQLPEDADSGFYKLINPLCPTSSNCPCMRLQPVQAAVEAMPIRTRQPQNVVKTKSKLHQLKPKKTIFGDTVVESIDARVPIGTVPHPKIYGQKTRATAADPIRTKASTKRKAAVEKRIRHEQKIKDDNKVKTRFLHQMCKETPKIATKQTPRVAKGMGPKETKKSSDQSTSISEEVLVMIKRKIVELEVQDVLKQFLELARQSNGGPTDKTGVKSGKPEQNNKLPRSRGGAAGDGLSWPSSANISDEIALLEQRIETAKTIGNLGIEVAATIPGHEISLYHPLPNNADGDCSLECCTDQINNTRKDFANIAGRYPSPIELRKAVVKALSYNDRAIERAGFVGREREFRQELKKLLEPKKWDTELGDIVLPGIALVLKKYILVYRTNARDNNFPIFAASPTDFGGEPDTDIPIVLCYTGSHYEGLVPRTEADVDKTVELLNAYLEGRLNVTVNDVPVLRNQILEQRRVSVAGSQKGNQAHDQELASTSFASRNSGELPLKKTKTTANEGGRGKPENGRGKRAHDQISTSNIEVPPSPKKSNPGHQQQPATQQDSFSSSAPKSEQCKVCGWEGKSLMAHLRSKKLKCSEAYDMKAERESRRKQTYQTRTDKQKAKNPEYFKTQNAKKVEAYQAKKRAENPRVFKEDQAKAKRKSREKAKAENPKEFKAHHAAEVKASRAKKKAENPTQFKAKDAAEVKASRAKKKAENPKEFKAHHAAEVKASRAKKKAENPEEFKAHHAKDKRKSRAKKKAENPTEFKAKNAAKVEVSRAKKRAENPTQFKEDQAKDKRKSREMMKAENPQKVLDDNVQWQRKSRAKKIENHNDMIRQFWADVEPGWTFSCVCCHRRRFSNQVDIYKPEEIIKHVGENMIKETIGDLNPEMMTDGQYNLCHHCRSQILKRKMPAMCHKNSLELVPIMAYEELQLTPLESSLIAMNIIFQYIVQLPKSRWSATKNKITNVPIFEQDVMTTVESLPRTVDEAGIIAVQLKRKKAFKHSHAEAFIRVNLLLKALITLRTLGHPHYQFSDDHWMHLEDRLRDSPERLRLIPDELEEPLDAMAKNLVETDGVLVDEIERENLVDEVEEKDPVDEMEKEEQKYQSEDQVQKFKIDFNRHTALLDQHPELDVTDLIGNSNTAVAPGEGKIPTNILADPEWDIKTFPQLFPDGKNAMKDPDRPGKLTSQQFVEQRVMNHDRRFSESPDFVFANYAYLERERLDKNVGISFQRGKKKANGVYSLDDPCSVLDNVPGTPRFWQKKKYELIAKLENLGAFQVFFTLSCADLRWHETFTAFLKDHKIHYEVINGSKECFVTNEHGTVKTLDAFMKEEENVTKYEFVRKNVLSATMHFNKRVQEFIKTIVMAKAEFHKMPVTYYNYRVEFQQRGAGHIHGTLWLDLEKLSQVIDTTNPEGREAMDESVKDQLPEEYTDPKYLEELFDRIKEDNIGLHHTDCDDQCEKCKDLESLAWFADRFITCTLKNPDTRDLALDLQQHKHFPQSCKKRGTNCRYGAPWFPCLKTVIQVPPRVKFKLETLTEEEKEKLISTAQEIQASVKNVLEDDEFMKKAQEHRKEDIDQYLYHRRMEQNIGRALLDRKPKYHSDPLKSCDPEVLDDYKQHIDANITSYSEMQTAGLIQRQNHHVAEKNKIPMPEIKRERLKLILYRAEVPGDNFEEKNKNYEDALSYSFKKGYSVNIKRDIDEILTNTYNPLWLQAWNANMDMQICLDFFAVITYITDYYMKDETGVVKDIKQALNQDVSGDLRSKLNLVKNVFLTHRQVGESELYYKMFPSLHLADSNCGAEFVPTGLPNNRSRFMRQVDMADGYKTDAMEQIEGREGKYYIEKTGMLEKYQRIPPALKGKLSYSQFVKRYKPVREEPKKYNFAKDLTTTVTRQMEKDGDYIFCDPDEEDDDELKMKLPDHIPLTDTEAPGEFQYMTRRKPKVIRYHKFNKTKEPHEFYFAELQLFYPFYNEEELHPDDVDACKKLYMRNEKQIEYIRRKVMPFTKKVVAGREMAEAIVGDIGDDLDPENQLENDQSAMEGVPPHPDYDVRHPERISSDPTAFIPKDNYRKIQLDTTDELDRKIRSLDPEQRVAFDTIVKWARDYVKAKKGKNPTPVAPNLLVHGGAGTGKSHIINVLSQYTERIFRTAGDAPNQPYVLKMAFTGSAAKIINGQTIQSVFHFQFGNYLHSLPLTARPGKCSLDVFRRDLTNLRLIIIDEISLVSADLLYGIHFRLMKEAFQNKDPFGGVAMVCFGDIMQIKPVQGTPVFEEIHNNPQLSLQQSIENLWRNFSVIILKTNHRQGPDKVYADILNRVRVGQWTHDDEKVLKQKVRAFDDSIPADALIVAGSNADVNKYNTDRLNKLEGDLVSLKATVFSDAQGIFKPKLNNDGSITGCQLQYNIDLKKQCRVMLTVNLDVCDGLVNGSLGTVIDIVKNQEGKVQYIMVEFDDKDDGKKRRANFDRLVSKYPGHNATPIEAMEWAFSQSKNKDGVHGTAIQFPLKLCYAVSAHKIQGSTVKKPTCIVLHLHGYLHPAMGYVMLSRIQCLDQLIIVKPPSTKPELQMERIKPWDSAMTELKRLHEVDFTVRPRNCTLSLASLNVRSLQKHFQDLEAFHSLMLADVICVQETWLEDGNDGQHYQLSHLNKSALFANGGRGKGVVIYYSDNFQPVCKIYRQFYQMAAVQSEQLVVVNIYRSDGAKNEEILTSLMEVLGHSDQQKATLLLGDFNFCERKEKSHPIREKIKNVGFKSLLDPPIATHTEGRCLDQAYIRGGEALDLTISARVGTCSFSDHDPVIVEVVEADHMDNNL